MKTIKIGGLLLAASLIIFSSCKKDKDNPAPSKTKTELLTASNWKFKAATISPAFFGQTNLFDASCDADNVIKFNSNLSGVQDPGAIKCDSSETVDNFTWAFSNSAQTAITMTSPEDGPQTANITTLTDSQLIITSTQDFGGTTYTTTLTFSH